MRVVISLPKPIVDQVDELAEEWGFNRSDAVYRVVTIGLGSLNKELEEFEEEEEEEE